MRTTRIGSTPRRGFAWIPQRDIIVRATALAEYDNADEDRNTNIELGVRVSGEIQYDSGIAWVDRKWSTSGFVEGRVRFYDEPDLLITPPPNTTTRRDFDIRSGIRQVFALKNGFGIQLDVDALKRESNIINFDLNNVSTTLSLQYRM